jgi:large subunit ribosomal protein L10
MDRAEKTKVVEELKELLLGRASVVLTDYRGMTVEDMFALRRECREAGVGYRVVKNTLAKLAIAGTDYELISEGLEGPVALAWSDDPVAPAKVLCDFVAKCEKLEVKLGFLDGKKLEVSEVKALAKLPSKDELRSSFLSVLNASASKFVGLLAAVPRDFVGVLTARKSAVDAG